MGVVEGGGEEETDALRLERLGDEEESCTRKKTSKEEKHKCFFPSLLLPVFSSFISVLIPHSQSSPVHWHLQSCLSYPSLILHNTPLVSTSLCPLSLSRWFLSRFHYHHCCSCLCAVCCSHQQTQQGCCCYCYWRCLLRCCSGCYPRHFSVNNE